MAGRHPISNLRFRLSKRSWSEWRRMKRETIMLSEEGFNQLLEELEKPPEPNEKLMEVMRRTPPWEKKDS